MASKASMSLPLAVSRAYTRGSAERKALDRFHSEGLNVNQDRPACLLVVKAYKGTPIGTVLKQAWNL